ncbi:MAG: hypothetical protein AAGA89_05680 [Pseudomonadota bacterium]
MFGNMIAHEVTNDLARGSVFGFAFLQEFRLGLVADTELNKLGLLG